MFDVLKWLIVIQLIGLFTLPIVNFIFPKLVDKGYCVSKILGILLIAFISWILNVYHILPSNKYSLWTICIFFGFIFDITDYSINNFLFNHATNKNNINKIIINYFID